MHSLLLDAALALRPHGLLTARGATTMLLPCCAAVGLTTQRLTPAHSGAGHHPLSAILAEAGITTEPGTAANCCDGTRPCGRCRASTSSMRLRSSNKETPCELRQQRQARRRASFKVKWSATHWRMKRFRCPIPCTKEGLASDAGLHALANRDHLPPWQAHEGHSGEASATMGALLARATRSWLVTMVTCLRFRYRPAAVAEPFASPSLPFTGRINLSVSSGEAPNEDTAMGIAGRSRDEARADKPGWLVLCRPWRSHCGLHQAGMRLPTSWHHSAVRGTPRRHRLLGQLPRFSRAQDRQH